MRALVAGLILSLSSAGAAAAQFDGQVDAYLGWRGLQNRDYWAGTADQFVFGVQANFGVDEFPLNGEIGILGSGRQRDFPGLTVTDSIYEISVGALYRPLKNQFVQPYVGAGLASIGAHEKLEDTTTGATFEDDDASGAVYAHAGVVFLIAHHVDVGIDARFLRGSDITLFSANGDANYNQVTLRVGYAWGTQPRAARAPRHERPTREREKRESRREQRRKKIPGSPEADDDAAVGF